MKGAGFHPTCESQVPANDLFPAQGYGYRCAGSELGHLFCSAVPDGLENPNYGDDSCDPCFQNTDPFLNILQDIYWSGTEYAADTNNSWEFNTDTGSQKVFPKAEVARYAWAVRPGQVQAAPEAGRSPCWALLRWAFSDCCCWVWLG